ncbi:hypothetical protein JOM56_015181 [Amanita muscaria]
MSASSSNSPSKSKSTTCGSSHKGKNSEEEAGIQRKRPSTASRPQSVESNMPASASKSPSKSITRGSSHKSKKPEKQVDIQRKRPSTASRLQSVAEDVRDAQSKKAADGGDHGTSIISTLLPPIIPEIPSMNQSREAGDGVDPGFPISTETPTVATETRSITLFQGSSNVQISNTKFTAIGGDATIFQFGGECA